MGSNDVTELLSFEQPARHAEVTGIAGEVGRGHLERPVRPLGEALPLGLMPGERLRVAFEVGAGQARVGEVGGTQVGAILV